MHLYVDMKWSFVRGEHMYYLAKRVKLSCWLSADGMRCIWVVLAAQRT